MGRIRNRQQPNKPRNELDFDDFMKQIKDLARKGNFENIESLLINNKKIEKERLEKDHAMLLEGARGLLELEKLKLEEELNISRGECVKLKGEMKCLSDGKNRACEEVEGLRRRLLEVEKHKELSGTLKLEDELKMSRGDCVKLKGEMKKLSDGKDRACEEVEGLRRRLLEVEKHMEMSSRAISAMRRKQMEDDGIMKELRFKVVEDEKIIIDLTRQNLRATQTVEQLKAENAEAAKAMEELQRQVVAAADELKEKTVQTVEEANGDTSTTIEKLRCQELNGARTIEMHRHKSGQVMVEGCQNQSGGDHILEKQHSLDVDAYETSTELRGQVTDSDGEGSPVEPALNSDVSAKTMSADETMKEMRQKQVEANQTVAELSCQSLEAPDTTDRLKLLHLAVETEKLELEDALMDTRQRCSEVEQTLAEQRCQNLEVSGVIEISRKNIPVLNVYKRRSDQTIDEMRRTQLEAAKIVEELRSKLLKAFQTIEELKHLILAADEAFEENKKRWEVLPRVKIVEEGLIRVLKIKVQDLTNEVMKDAASLNLPLSEGMGKLLPGSSWMGEGGENQNVDSPHQAAETNIAHGQKETVNSHGSDPIEVTDIDHDAVPSEFAYNADLSLNPNVDRATCMLPSLRKRSSLRDENDGLLNSRNKNRRIQDSTYERDESGRIKSPGKSNSGFTAVVRVSRKRKEKAIAACDSRTQNQYIDSFSNSSSTDSEDESCPEYLDGIRPSCRNQKHQKAWVSGSDMLNDFREDIELCMNVVCVLYRQEISVSESSVGSHAEFIHFHAMGGRALAEYLIDGDPLNRLKKLLSEVKQQRPEVLVQCRKVAMDYSDKLFSIYNNGEDPFFKSRCISSSIEAAETLSNASIPEENLVDVLPASDLGAGAPNSSRYEAQKRRDWDTFRRFLLNQRPSVALPQCNKKHVLDFLGYMDQFGKTKVHSQGCAFHGKPEQSVPCTCPLRQAWGSLDSTIGRLRAAYEDNVGSTMSNPFASMVVRNHLKQVKESQAIARGVSYKKKRKEAS